MYLLSIVIPTRNRQQYALESVKQILNVIDDRVQIVITDNSDENSLEKEIKQLGSPQIKYLFIDHRIPGVDNYAKGIELSDAKYICCIGDDDGILGCIVDIVEWMESNGVSALKPGVQAAYICPGATKDYTNGCMGLGDISCHVTVVDPRDELAKFLKSGCIDFPNAKLVKAYHGIVRKDQFNKIYRKTNRYCGGLSPDIYLSVALSAETDRLLCIDIPLTIFGACRSSTTADSFNKINTGKLEDAPHFVGQPYEWSTLIPRYYSGANIWADSALHALTDMNCDDYLQMFALDIFTAYSLHYYKSFKKEILENYEKNHGNMDALNKQIKKEAVSYYVAKFKEIVRGNKALIIAYRGLKGFIKKTSGSEAFIKTGVYDIGQAERLTSDVVKKYCQETILNLQRLKDEG